MDLVVLIWPYIRCALTMRRPCVPENFFAFSIVTWVIIYDDGSKLSCLHHIFHYLEQCSYNKASSLGAAASAWTLDRIRDPPLFTLFSPTGNYFVFFASPTFCLKYAPLILELRYINWHLCYFIALVTGNAWTIGWVIAMRAS